MMKDMDVNFIAKSSRMKKVPRPAESEVPMEPVAELAAVRSESKHSRSSLYNTVVQVILLVTAAVVPLLYLPLTSSVLEYNKQVFLVLFASIALVVWLLGVVVSGTLTIRRSPLDKGVLVVWLATVVATLFSIAKAKSVFGLTGSLSSSLITVTAFSVWYFLAVNVFHDHGRVLRRVISLSVIVALLTGIMQILGIFILPGAFTHIRAFTVVGAPNTLGVIAAVCLVLFAKTAVRRSGIFDRLIGSVGFVLGLTTLVLLNWWVLWGIALMGILALIAFDSVNATQLSQDYGRARRGKFSLSRFVIPMMVLVVAGFFLLINVNIGSLRSQLPAEVAPSYPLSWNITKEVLSEKLLYGYGPENFSLAFDTFGAHRVSNTQWMSSKFFDGISEIFTAAVQGGALLLLAIGILFWCIVQMIGRFSRTIAGSVARGEGAVFAIQSSGIMAALIGLVAAMFLYPWNITLSFFWYMALALVALLMSEDQPQEIDIEERPAYSLFASLGFVVGLILVLTGIYFSTTRYLADVQYARAAGASTPSALITGLDRALSLNAHNDQYLRDRSQASLVLLNAEINTPAKAGDTQRTARMQNAISVAVQFAQRATQVAPREALNWSNLGQVYGSLSGIVENVEQLAADAFARAASLRPGDAIFDNQIGSVWTTRADRLRQIAANSSGNAQQLQNQINEALNNAVVSFKRALDISPDFGLAIYNLGGAYERQGKVTESITQLERLVPYNSSDTTLIFQLGLLYIRAGQRDNAMSAMQRVILLAPQHANAHWYLALLYEDKGDIASALAELRSIEADNKDNEVLKQKIAALEAGQRATPGKVIDTKPLQ